MNRVFLFAVPLGATLALLLGSGGAHAQNLILNGGFESNAGDFTPPDIWITDNDFSAPTGFNGLAAHSGAFYLGMGTVGTDSSTNQTIATSAGALYHLQFFYIADGGTPGDLNVSWNGANIYSETSNGTPHDWEQHDFFVTGTGSDVLNFGGRNDPTWNGVDDVSLTVVGVPEPATLAMFGMAAAGISGGVWRRRKSARKKVRRVAPAGGK